MENDVTAFKQLLPDGDGDAAAAAAVDAIALELALIYLLVFLCYLLYFISISVPACPSNLYEFLFFFCNNFKYLRLQWPVIKHK